MTTKPEPPKSCHIHIRKLDDDLIAWSVKFKIDVGDIDSLDRLSAKAQQCLQGLEHALIGRQDIGAFGHVVSVNATTHYIDDTDVARAVQEVREYFKWIKQEEARKPKIVLATTAPPVV